MTVSREAVMQALFARLSTSSVFVTAGRRNRKPETFKPTETPALMLVEAAERYKAGTPMQPIRKLMVKAIVYHDIGADETAIPAAIINGLLDGIDVALAPDPGAAGKCTLGGLVTSVSIEGDIAKAPGDVTGKSIAVVPISILLP